MKSSISESWELSHPDCELLKYFHSSIGKLTGPRVEASSGDISHLNYKLVVGHDHLSSSEGPVVDGFGRGLGHAVETLLWPSPGSDQLDWSWDLRLDWNINTYNPVSRPSSSYSSHSAEQSSPPREELRWWRYTCRLPSRSWWPCAAGSPPPPPSQLETDKWPTVSTTTHI